jgi:tetratricopeptide (TPR) repeat protein
LPSESSRLNQLGLAAYQQKRYDDAVEYYRQAMRWHRLNHEAKSNLALAYLRLKQPTRAIEVANEVLQTTDAPAAIRAASAYNLGLAYESLGERQRATELYVRALQLQPSQARRDAVERMQGRGGPSQ